MEENKLLYVRTEVRGDEWEIRLQFDAGGVGVRFRKGDPRSLTIEELRRMADLLAEGWDAPIGQMSNRDPR